MFPIVQPVANPLLIPTSVPPEKAVITCVVSLGSKFETPDIETENHAPMTNDNTTKINQTTIFLLFGLVACNFFCMFFDTVSMDLGKVLVYTKFKLFSVNSW